MNEDEFNMDLEIEALLSQERKKEPYILESVELERQAVVEAFYGHYTTLTGFEEVATVEDFLAATTFDESTAIDEFDNDDVSLETPFIAELNDLIGRDIETHDILHGGEMHIGGEGLYMYKPDFDAEDDLDILEDGATLIGDVRWYSVAPMIPYESFLKTQYGESYEQADYDDVPDETPGLWLLMANATLRDSSGNDVASYDEVLIPFTYPSLTFSKVMRRSDIVVASSPESQAVHVDVATHFTGEFILELCRDIENDINYNDYEGEEFHGQRETHQGDIDIYMSVVERERNLRLTAVNATLINGDSIELSNQAVQYMQPVLMNLEQAWRVVHAFTFQNEKEGTSIAHVLPEHIVEINYLDEQ